MDRYLLSRPAYRARQFFGALWPRFNGNDHKEALRALGPSLSPLFESMPPHDQRHCFAVYRSLLARGVSDEHLLTAALLHDAGKGALAGGRIRLWHRVARVILAATAPRTLRRLSKGRGGLADLYHHSARGAVLAEAHGAHSEVVDLIARIDSDHAPDELLRLLRAADDSC